LKYGKKEETKYQRIFNKEKQSPSKQENTIETVKIKLCQDK